MDLSILIPTLRTHSWEPIIDAIEKSCHPYTWEIIFVGPYYNSCIEKYKNIKYVRDFGSPNRCQQIGLILAEGKFVTWLVDDYDDGPNNISKFLDMIYDTRPETIVVGNYDENGIIAVENFSIRHCYGGGKYVDPSWVIFNVAFLHRSFLLSIGGFDCNYNVTCIGHTDVAVRCQYHGCEVINANMKIGGVVWLPDITGDHAPVHNNQLCHDQPLFVQKTNDPIQPYVDISNWQDSPAVWNRFDD
jgi:hypothetical protein